MPDRRVTAAQRRIVFERARGCCEYCRSQARFATQTFAAEHIIPRQAGGRTELDNDDSRFPPRIAFCLALSKYVSRHYGKSDTLPISW